MAAPTYGSRCFKDWRAAAPEWEAYTRHDFVEGLRGGTLPRDAFLRYLVQDYLFLIHFSRAWALAVVKAASMDEMRACSATLQALIHHEMELHISTCAEAGIAREELEAAEEHPANLAYTRYVLDAGFSGDFLDLMAALAPCVLGYGEIGHRLGQEAESEVYRSWIDTYSGPDYQGLCESVGALLDRAAADRLGEEPWRSPRWEKLARRFATATRLEVAFWGIGFDPASR